MVSSGMPFRTLLLFLVFAVSSAWTQEDANFDEWVIEFHQFPEPGLVEGFTSPKLGFLKAPPLPAADASEEEIETFMKESNEIVSHFFEFIGVSSPKGTLFTFDPESFTLAARLPRGASRAVRKWRSPISLKRLASEFQNTSRAT